MLTGTKPFGDPEEIDETDLVARLAVYRETVMRKEANELLSIHICK